MCELSAIYLPILLLIGWHWGSFQFGAVTNGAAENRSFGAGISVGHLPRSRTAGSLHLHTSMYSSSFGLLFHLIIPKQILALCMAFY